jgi:aminocarboxymuconate-semialdehyde decarboxylase
MIIDMHAHLYPRRFMEELARSGGRYGVGLERARDGRQVLRFEGIRFWWYVEAFYDVDQRLAAMDRAEVNLQVLSMGPPMVYWADPELGAHLSRILNEEIACVVERYPERFVAFAAVPLQDTARALEELQHAVRELGHRGVGIGSNLNGKALDHPDLDPFWSAAQDLELPVFVHPINPPGQPAVHDYRLDLIVGFPFDTTLAAARLIYGGVLERFPKLKLIFAHLGGGLPYLKERLEIGYHTRGAFPDNALAIPKAPSEYLRLCYFDAVSFDHPALMCALACAGPERLVLGSDAPFAVGDIGRSVALIRDYQFASDGDKVKMLGENAAQLLKLTGGR